ncbi:TATA-box-binding protein [Methanolacinia paynteri]|uniref:TATA-box-binding protein n=1 Tax=Methanolacinia paynteri TaxID=230356 RepID=UPI00064F2987|nr:TATA-box-binding protein [Methanolacinia paynteri]
MKEDYSSLRIENIVATGSIADSIDPEFIAKTLPNCTFNKKKFPGAVYHLKNPKAAALIFASGKVVLTGVRNNEDLSIILQTLQNDLKEAGVTCFDEPQIAVTNMVCSYDLGYALNLNRVVVTLMDSESVEYEPEVFPGLVLRIFEPNIVFLLFGSGKIIITGGKNIEDVKRSVGILREKLSIVGPKSVPSEK